MTRWLVGNSAALAAIAWVAVIIFTIIYLM
jgi:hypothetical protein